MLFARVFGNRVFGSIKRGNFLATDLLFASEEGLYLKDVLYYSLAVTLIFKAC